MSSLTAENPPPTPAWPRWQYRLATYIVLTAAALAAISALMSFATIARGVGSFSLTVSVVSDDPVNALSYAMTMNREIAEFIARDSRVHFDVRWDSVELEDGTFQALGQFTSAWDIFGRELSFNQERYIILRYSDVDGKSTCKVAEIPEGRGARSMKIVLP